MDATAKPLGNPKWQPWGGPSHQAFSNRFFGVLITQSTKGEMLGHLWQSHTTIDEYTDIRQLLERRAIVTEALNMMERPVDIPLGFSYTVLNGGAAASLLRIIDETQTRRVTNYLDFHYKKRYPGLPSVTIESVADIPHTSQFWRQGAANFPGCQNPGSRISIGGHGVLSVILVRFTDYIIHCIIDMEFSGNYPIIAPKSIDVRV
jgi:hypothetical protein